MRDYLRFIFYISWYTFLHFHGTRQWERVVGLHRGAALFLLSRSRSVPIHLRAGSENLEWCALKKALVIDFVIVVVAFLLFWGGRFYEVFVLAVLLRVQYDAGCEG